MPKLKTNKAAKKRYSLTATGKVKRTKSNRRHLIKQKTLVSKQNKKTKKIRKDSKCLCRQNLYEYNQKIITIW